MTATALLSLWAETSIHAGAGSAVGVIDLPIQREGHSGWPCVYGSSVKGALRAKAERKGFQELDVIFGPDTAHASDHAGALAVGDARLLLLPVRSLTSHFKWVSCPALLARLKRDAERLGLSKLTGFSIPDIQPDQAILPQVNDDYLFLEEYRFQTQPKDLDQLIQVLSELLDMDQAGDLLQQQLCLVTDDRFRFFADHATPVAAHIAIDNKTKVVKPGALWYEETLPPETILYTALNAWSARKQGVTMDANTLLTATLEGLFDRDKNGEPYLQLGGNETVGMGWCRVKPVWSNHGKETK